MIGAAATRATELLPLRVRLRGVRAIGEEQNEQIINKAGRSTYPDKKSVLRTEATRECNTLFLRQGSPRTFSANMARGGFSGGLERLEVKNAASEKGMSAERLTQVTAFIEHYI